MPDEKKPDELSEKELEKVAGGHPPQSPPPPPPPKWVDPDAQPKQQ